MTNLGLHQNKGSFEAFFNTYLNAACHVDKKCAKVISEGLCEAPYNLAFGFYLVKNWQEIAEEGIFDLPSLLSTCKNFYTDFDLYNLTGGRCQYTAIE